MKRNYIGLANSFHDSAIAIVSNDGEVLFAEASERYLQNKRSIGIAPDLYMRAIELVNQYCDPDADIVLASTWSSELMREALSQLKGVDVDGMIASDMTPTFIRRQLSGQQFFFKSQLSMLKQPGHLLEYSLAYSDTWSKKNVESRYYHHHKTHAAAGCYSSPFDNALCAVLDGMGELSSFACYHYVDGTITEIGEINKDSRASLGLFYTTICETCGFDPLSGEEWKVMGLASYGKHDPELYSIMRAMIIVDDLMLKNPEQEELTALSGRLFARRRKLEEPLIQYADLAYTAQQVFTEVLFEFLCNLHGTGLSENLVLSGGCALNSSANGKIIENTPFENLHVYSAPGDDGNAVGAALLAFNQDNKNPSPARFMSPYLGSTMKQKSLDNVLQFSGLKTTRCGDEAPKLAANMLQQGKIIGWIQGRAEFGPRALGNRSILADPRSADVKEKINASVKFREEFRPFAPSILHEYGSEYFEHYQESPYMERTLTFKESVMNKVPGVVHEDRTGRLQTVKHEWNPKYYDLISSFYQLTNIPLVLNTSFNVMGKPISHSVEDALAVFFTSGLDALFIDGIMIEK